MTLVSLLAALALEQWRPVRRDNFAVAAYLRYCALLERQFNAGERYQAAVALIVALVPVVAIAWSVYALAYAVSPVLAWLWNVAVLYLTMGFRQFSHAFTAIEKALRRGDGAQARELLSAWRGESAQDLSSTEVARLAIEQGLVDSHRYVFGPILWFVLLPGPAGAVLYRAAALAVEAWSKSDTAEAGAFRDLANRAFRVLDWLPARLTAVSFAIVGDFEDAVYCWRSQARAWIDRAQGIILASGAGALGVRLGEPLHRGGTLFYRPELGVGDEADADMMRSTVGLVWRSVVGWFAVLLLVGIARWLGF